MLYSISSVTNTNKTDPQNDRLNFNFVKDFHVCSWRKKWPEMVEKRQLGLAGGGGYQYR